MIQIPVINQLRVLLLSLAPFTISASSPYLPECYPTNRSDKTTHYIGYWAHKNSAGNWSPAGFFSAVMGVLNNVQWAVRHGKKPFVYWGPISPYYQANQQSDHNAWTDYFEQLSDAQFDPQKDSDKLYTHYWDPDDQTVFTPGSLPNKKQGHYLIKKYLIIKPNIQKKIDAFYAQHMTQAKTVGVHLRGTDKSSETNQPNPDAILTAVNKWITQQTEPVQCFVISDEEQLVQYAQKHLIAPVICYPAHRSTNKQPIHYYEDPYSPYLKGEEVLIETVLLSKCAALFRHESNVSYMAVQFNPHIEDHCIVPERYIIGKPHFTRPYGVNEELDLFPSLFSTLSHLYYCEATKQIPVIYWNNQSDQNEWDTLFQPVSHAYMHPGDTINTAPTRYGEDGINYNINRTAVDQQYRTKVAHMIARYIRLHPELSEHIDQWYNNNLAPHNDDIVTIGIHCLGLDARMNQEPCNYQLLIQHALHLAQYLESTGKRCQFFIASEEEGIIVFYAQSLLRSYPVLWYPRYRSNFAASNYNDSNHNQIPNSTKQWRYTMIDTYLLARCDHVIHTDNPQSYFVRLLNPTIFPHCITLFGNQDPYCHAHDIAIP